MKIDKKLIKELSEYLDEFKLTEIEFTEKDTKIKVSKNNVSISSQPQVFSEIKSEAFGFFIKFFVDAAIHAVACNDEVGICFGEDSLQSFEETRPRKSSTSVVFFAQSGNRFAAQPAVDDG